MFFFSAKNSRAQRLKFCVTILLFVLTISLLFSLSYSKDIASAEDSAKEVEISGVQLRADPPASLYYLVLITKEYSIPEKTISDASAYMDLLSKITLYTSPEDTTGVSAADICITNNWYINRWGSGGLLIAMTAENYETYSGSSV